MKKIIVVLSALAFCISSFINLEPAQNQRENTLENTPPIAQKIELIKLSKVDNLGNNYLYKAHFSAKEQALRGKSSISVNTGKGNFILTDDGKGGDEKSGDFVFTTSLKMEDNLVQKLVETQNQLAEKAKFQQVSFVNRSQVIEKVQKADFRAVLEGKSFEINPLLTASIFLDPVELNKLKEKSLLINDVTVVEDPTRTYDPCKTANKGNSNGVWAFHKLVANMANTPLTTVSTKDFMIDWVDNHLFAQITHPNSSDVTINKVASKTRVIRAWYKNSGGVLLNPGIPSNWKSIVKPEEFPVRLLAIVNRLDLRGNMGYGNTNGGEGRFVFCFIDENCNHGNNGPGTMTFILEYGIPIANCTALADYARKWWILKDIPFGSSYNSQLEIITNVFTKANANASRPNKSALNHMRTNDFISGSWEIRDFEIDVTSKKLKIIPPNKEPKRNLQGTTALATRVNGIANINNYSIPSDEQGMSALLPTPSFRWNSSGITNANNRREFSFNSCSSCHTGETRHNQSGNPLSNSFTHIRPRNIGTKAVLSQFLTGLGNDDLSTDNDTDPLGNFVVNDVTGSGLSPKNFNETKRRAEDLELLAFDAGCSSSSNFPFQIVALSQRLKFQPINMEH